MQDWDAISSSLPTMPPVLIHFCLLLQKIIPSFNAIFVCVRSHEQMSVKMVDHIVDEHHIDIDTETIKEVKVSSSYWGALFIIFVEYSA